MGWTRAGVMALRITHGACVFLPADGATVENAPPQGDGPILHTFVVGSLWSSTDQVKIAPLNPGGGSSFNPIPGADFAPEWLSDSVDSGVTIGGQPIYGRVGEFDLTRLQWNPSPANFGDDGRDFALFALQSGNLGDGMLLTGTQGFFGCLFDNAAAPADAVVFERCRFGRNLNTNFASLGPPVKLWRARSLASVPAAVQTTFKRWVAPVDGGSPVFTHHLVSRACTYGTTAANDTLGPVVVANEIRFMTPIGEPSTGETKPHIYVKNTVNGVAPNENAAEFNEALGYDCPMVLADTASLGMPEAVRRHSALAVDRCAAFAACNPSTVCTGIPLEHRTANPNWVPRNRLYLGAPGAMVPINVARYLEPRAGYAGVSGLGPEAPEWTNYRIVLRFGAGQLMMFDHLSHVLAVDASTVQTGQGTQGTGIANGSLLQPGKAVGFIYRIEPWIRRRSDQGATPRLPFVGNGFDWTVYDLLGPANQFANQPRYEEANGAIPQFGVSTNSLFGRCPIDFFDTTTMGAEYRDRIGTSRTSAPEPGTPCQYAMNDFYPNTGRILRDRPGTLTGNWFKAGVDANGEPLRGFPALALASSGPIDSMANPSATVATEISFRDPAPMGGPESVLQFRVCATIQAMMPSVDLNTMCMNMGMSTSGRRPELVTPNGVSSICYESNAPLEADRWHARFMLSLSTPTDPDTRATLIAFRGRGSCPTDPSEVASLTRLMRDGFEEFGREDFVR